MRSLSCRDALIAMVGLLALQAPSAQAAPTSRNMDRDAAYLQEAFNHDLCTRNDRELHTFTKALSKRTRGSTR